MNRGLRALVTAWADAAKDALQPIRDILPVHLLMNPDPLRSHPIHPEGTPVSDDSTPAPLCLYCGKRAADVDVWCHRCIDTLTWMTKCRESALAEWEANDD